MNYLFMVSIEPNTYFLWQTELWLYSFVKYGKVSQSQILLVIHGKPKNQQDTVYLNSLLSLYPNIRVLYTKDYNNDTWTIWYKNGVQEYSKYWCSNKYMAIADAWNKGYLNGFDYLVTTDADMFVHEFLCWDRFPTVGNSMAFYWHGDSKTCGAWDGRNRGRGVDMEKLLSAVGAEICKVEQGSIIMFLKCSDITERLVNVMISYMRLLYNAYYVAGDRDGSLADWYSTEMLIYPAAYSHCGLKVDVLDWPELHPTVIHKDVAPGGSIIHYCYSPVCFPESDFSKRNYFNNTPFVENLQVRSKSSKTVQERSFWRQLNECNQLYNIIRPST